MPYDNFVLTLARSPNGEGAVFEQRLGRGRILLSAGGSLFTNRSLGNDDNARLFGNIVSCHGRARRHRLVRRPAAGTLGELRPGALLSRSAPAADGAHRVRTVARMGARFDAPARTAAIVHEPSEAELVRHAGNFIARAVAPHHTAIGLFDDFFRQVARAARGTGAPTPADPGDLWQWLERHAAILPQELDQLKAWYAEAHSARRPPLAPLQNLLDNLARRLQT